MLWSVLSLVRFLLAIVVASHHTTHINGKDTLLAHFSPFTAVLAFLLLSGYSIAHSLERNQVGFYRRRLLRIVPVYLLSLLVCGCLKSLYGGELLSVNGSFYEYPTFSIFLQNLFFLQGFTIAGNSWQLNGAVWSISLEVFFYLLAPFLYKMKEKGIYYLFGTSAIAFCLYPCFFKLPYYSLSWGLACLFLGWAWLLGFWFYFHRNSNDAKVALIAVGIVLFSFNSLHTRSFYQITYLFTCLALIYGDKIRVNKLSSLFNYLGNISYPLYLLHFPVYLASVKFGIESEFSFLFLALTVSMIGNYIDTVIKKAIKELKSSDRFNFLQISR